MTSHSLTNIWTSAKRTTWSPLVCYERAVFVIGCIARLAGGAFDCSRMNLSNEVCQKQIAVHATGHCLVWKGIGWMSEYPEGTTDAERNQLYLDRIESYIKTMMTRYKGAFRVGDLHLVTS